MRLAADGQITADIVISIHAFPRKNATNMFEYDGSQIIISIHAFPRKNAT